MDALLHICCGVCASAVAERLMCQGYKITGFFYNPNIHPEDEYKRRLGVAQKVSKELGFELVEGLYDREKWFEAVKGFEYEPEGARRCDICIRMRLEKTYAFFRKKGTFRIFASTLSVSPHKDAKKINAIGMEIGGDAFYVADFKVKGGFQRAMELAKEWDLWRQHYCGCIYGLEAEERRKLERRGAKDEDS